MSTGASGRNTASTGYWAGSDISGDAAAIDRISGEQPPLLSAARRGVGAARSRATSLTGSSARIAIRKIGGERIRFESSAGFKSPGFDISDVGFFRRADDKTMNNWLQIRSEKPSRWFRAQISQLQSVRSLELRRRFARGAAETSTRHATFTNSWQAGGGYNFNQRYFDDRLSRGGPGGLFEDYNGVWYYINSDDRHAVSFAYNGDLLRRRLGSWMKSYQPNVTVRPVPSLSVVAGIRVSNSVADTQWVNNVTDTKAHYVFGHLAQTTVSFNGRVSYTMSRRCRSSSTRSRSFGRRLQRLQGARGRPKPRRMRTVFAVRVRTIRTSTTVRSGPPTSCAGSTGPARPSLSSGSRPARQRHRRHIPVPRRFPELFSTRWEERLPGEARLLVELLIAGFLRTGSPPRAPDSPHGPACWLFLTI